MSRVDVVIRSVSRFAVKPLTLGGGFAQALALKGEPVGVVHEAIEDSVGDGGVADDVVPMLDGELAGDDRGATAVPVLHDFQEVAALLGEHRRQSPVIQDEQLDASKRLEQTSMPAVAASKRKRIEEPRQPAIADRSVVAASLVAERTGNPTLADAGQAYDIVPKNTRLKLSSIIHITLAQENASLPLGDSSMEAFSTLQ